VPGLEGLRVDVVTWETTYASISKGSRPAHRQPIAARMQQDRMQSDPEEMALIGGFARSGMCQEYTDFTQIGFAAALSQLQHGYSKVGRRMGPDRGDRS